ncbi:hypothetical protein B0J18DRAFT_426109 [Chaetomium sp. MPI-SDFR-AT-0129]|nr:hypothetical protein B0J18DRAFT_426109 [Chaetomium sp. MPI-SDFR-AT-0129]
MSNISLPILWRSLLSQFRTLPQPSHSYAGCTAIVTGANSGLGLEAARHLARLGAGRVILACRNSEKGEEARRDIEASIASSSTPDSGADAAAVPTVIEVWPVDLCSFESVRAFCERAERELDRLDVLLANAAVLSIRPPGTMVEGYERQVTTNVISTFLMVLALLPVMKRTAAKWNVESVVTVVSSDAHGWTPFGEQDEPQIFEAFRPGGLMNDRYATTKLLDLLLARELAARLDAAAQPNPEANPIIVNAVNPGLCKSNLFQDLVSFGQFVVSVGTFFVGRTIEQGSRALMAGVEGGRASHGKYVDSGVIGDPSPFVLSEKGAVVQKKVWEELMGILEGIWPGVTASVTQVPSLL